MILTHRTWWRPLVQVWVVTGLKKFVVIVVSIWPCYRVAFTGPSCLHGPAPLTCILGTRFMTSLPVSDTHLPCGTFCLSKISAHVVATPHSVVGRQLKANGVDHNPSTSSKRCALHTIARFSNLTTTQLRLVNDSVATLGKGGGI